MDLKNKTTNEIKLPTMNYGSCPIIHRFKDDFYVIETEYYGLVKIHKSEFLGDKKNAKY